VKTMDSILKYPRTPHLEGSRLQPGDEDLDQLRFKNLENGLIVAEEKLDGANAGLSFGPAGELLLQSRGHYLTGGGREKHFALFKTWASCHKQSFWKRLGSRFVVYGEWLYAKHTIYYDKLPHYFLEFDVFDKQQKQFLSTKARRNLLEGLPIKSVPVLWQGRPKTLEELISLVDNSTCKSLDWRNNLEKTGRKQQLDVERIVQETDPSDHMEGLYIKIERDGEVVGRCKWIRASFLTSVIDSGSHWLQRPIVPNILGDGIDIFGESD